MELHARLIHAETDRRVVEVRASLGEQSLGSALAEARTVQDAEDLAIARLLRRLQGVHASDGPGLSGAAQATSPMPPEPGKAAAAQGEGRLPSRSDWKVDLTTPPATTARRSTDSDTPSDPQPQDTPTLRPPLTAQRPPEPSQAASAVVRRPPQSAAAATAGDATAAASSQETAGARVAARPQRPPGEHQADAEAGAVTPDAVPVSLQSDPQEEPPADPEDWSQELTAVDLELRRLGWNREQEGTYLQRAFGHPSRSRLTRYSDLRAYLTALESLERDSDPAVAAVPLRRSELLAQGDALLAQLGWSAEQGRAFLEQELQRISRQQLSDVQLLQFNILLESELLASSAPPAKTGDGAQR